MSTNKIRRREVGQIDRRMARRNDCGRLCRESLPITELVIPDILLGLSRHRQANPKKGESGSCKRAPNKFGSHVIAPYVSGNYLRVFEAKGWPKSPVHLLNAQDALSFREIRLYILRLEFFRFDQSIHSVLGSF